MTDNIYLILNVANEDNLTNERLAEWIDKHRPKEIYVSQEQQKHIFSCVLGNFEFWRGIPLKVVDRNMNYVLAARMGFSSINFKGVELPRDKKASSAVIYVRPVRQHWWQFWRQPQTYINFKDIM